MNLRNRWLGMYLVTGLLSVAGCAGMPMGSSTFPGTVAGEPSNPPQAEALARDAFERINRRRQSVGLQTLAWDAKLADLAAEHSTEMASGRRPFGHDGFEARMAAARSSQPVSRGSENVGRNTYPPSQAVAVAVDGWIASPEHRRNLEGTFTATGVGVARSPNGEYFLTQLFISP